MAGAGNRQKHSQAVGGHQQRRCSRIPESFVNRKHEPHEDVRLLQVCEQRLSNRIGIGANDGPDGVQQAGLAIQSDPGW